jgi:hypothetical protein
MPPKKMKKQQKKKQNQRTRFQIKGGNPPSDELF